MVQVKARFSRAFLLFYLSENDLRQSVRDLRILISMLVMTTKHRWGNLIINERKVFAGVDTLQKKDKAIVAFSQTVEGDGPDDTPENYRGMAEEVYVEKFLTYFMRSDPTHPGWVGKCGDLQDTSSNKFNPGFDYTAKYYGGGESPQDVLISVKYRSNPGDVLPDHYTLWKQALLYQRRTGRRPLLVLVTNLILKKGQANIFASEDEKELFDFILDRTAQKGLIDRDASNGFWPTLWSKKTLVKVAKSA